MVGPSQPTGVDRQPVLSSAISGETYRITPQPTGTDGGFVLADTEEFTVQLVPTEVGGTLHLETPNIDPQDKARVDVFENAEPDGTADDTANDLLIHNQRYDTGVGQETPDATIRRITNGSLNTTPADQTEHRVIRTGRQYEDSVAGREFWRTVPFGDNITIRITDVSGGNNNALDFALVLHEGEILPD